MLRQPYAIADARKIWEQYWTIKIHMALEENEQGVWNKMEGQEKLDIIQADKTQAQ